MEHVNDNELLEHIAGRLPEAKSRRLREHVTGCPDCEKRYRDAVDVWDSLGSWNVDPSGHEIADRIEALAIEDKSGRRESKTIPFVRSSMAWLRVAAMVALAIGVGHLLGKYSLPRHTMNLPVSQEEPRYVSALGFEWASEMTWAVLEEDKTMGETN